MRQVASTTAGRGLALLAIVATALVVLGAGAAPAAAQQDDGQPATAFSCRITDTVDGQVVDRSLLPLNRWGDAAAGGMHTRLEPGTVGLDNLENRTIRGTIVGGSLSIGNSLWQGTASLLEFATTMRVLDSAGCAADRAAATIGRAIVDSGLLTAAVVVLLIGIAWRSWRQGASTGTWTSLGRAALVVALFAIMLSGATRTSGPRDLGAGSPAWLLTNLEDVIGSVASAPAHALDASVSGGGLVVDDATGDAMGCDRYVEQLRSRYAATLGGGGLTATQASVPLAMSAMWERSGLQIYADAQFGPGNPFGGEVGCRLLERRAQVPADQQRALTAAASGAGTGMVESAADVVFVGSDALTTDRVIVAWASCDFPGSWSPNSQWQQVEERDPVTAAACSTLFWTDGDVGATQFDDPVNGEQSSPFEFAETPEELPQHVLDAEVQDFLLNFHGHTVMRGLTVSGVYVLVSLVVAAVFGLLALGIIVAKIALVALAAMAFVALLLALLPSSGGARLARYGRMVVGLLMLALGSQLLLALVLVLTDLVASAGFAVFDGATVEGVIWLGFAPVAAVVTLHLLITRGLGAPSPFAPSSALAYGRAFASGTVTTRGIERLQSFVRAQGGFGVGGQPDPVERATTAGSDNGLEREPAVPHSTAGRGSNRQPMAARELRADDGQRQPTSNGPPLVVPAGERDRGSPITPRRSRRDDDPGRGAEHLPDHEAGPPSRHRDAHDDPRSHGLDPDGPHATDDPDDPRPGDPGDHDDPGGSGAGGRDPDTPDERGAGGRRDRRVRPDPGEDSPPGDGRARGDPGPGHGDRS